MDPGTSCPVIAVLRNADFAVLVTEPTPFGLNDLALAIDTVREIGVPCGVVINRAEADNTDANDFCSGRGVEILAEIPNERAIAECYSHGSMIVATVPGMEKRFNDLWETLRKRVNQ